MKNNRTTLWAEKIPGMFRVKRRVLIALFACAFLPVSAQEPNYVEFTIHDVDTRGSNVVSRTYSDGLGRTLQTQSKVNGLPGPNNFHIVASGTEYNEVGRPIKTLKPFGLSGTQFGFMSQEELTSNASLFFDGTDETRPTAGGFPYSETEYDKDPLGRVHATGAPGASFSLSSQHAAKQWNLSITETAFINTTTQGFLAASDLTEINLNSLNPDASDYFLTVSMDPNGHFTQEIKDKFGRVLRTWAQSGDAAKGPIISKYTYDLFGNVKEETPPSTTSRKDEDVATSNYLYNSLGQLKEKTNPDLVTDGKYTYNYDEAGRLKTTTDPNGTTLEYEYDALGRNTAMYQVAGNNKYLKIRNFYDDPEQILEEIFLNNIAPQITIEPGKKATPIQIEFLFYSLLNTKGRLLASISYDEFDSRMYFCAINQYIGDTRVINIYSYDEEGRIMLKYKSVPGLPLQEFNYYYDDHGKIVIVGSGDYWTESNNRRATVYEYDENGRLSTISRDGREFLRYEYDIIGKVKNKIFREGMSKVSYGYNIRDWTENITAKDELSNDLFSTTIHYDKRDVDADDPLYNQYNGNISRVEYLTNGVSNGRLDFLYTYDPVNRLTLVNNQYNTQTTDDYDASYSYMNDGRFIRKNEGIQQKNWEDYKYYSASNKLLGIDASTTIADGRTRVGTTATPNYIYDNNGNRVFDRSKKMVIQYDWRNFAKRFLFYSQLPASVEINNWSQVQTIRSNPAMIQYFQNEILMTYDADGNRVLKENIGPDPSAPDPASLAGLAITQMTTGASYTITNAGAIATTLPITNLATSPVSDALLITQNNTTMAAMSTNGFQTGGTLVAQGQTVPTAGALVGSTKEAATPQFAVTGNGNVLVSGTMPSPSVIGGVAYVDDAEVYTFDPRSPGAEVEYELSYANIDGEGVQRPNGTFDFYVRDHLGSTRLVVTEDGIRKEATNYYPYGTEKPLQEPTYDQQARKKFTGKEMDYDGGINLMYFGARYYDPEIGYWASVEPESEPQDWGSYAYCGENPVSRTDPNGRWWETGLDVASLGYDYYEYLKKPTLAGAGTVLWGAAAIALPGVPGSWIAKGGVVADLIKKADKASDASKAAGKTDAAAPLAKVGEKTADVKKVEEGADIKKPAIIGETQENINQFAKDHYYTISDWMKENNIEKWSQPVNDQFIAAMKKEGREIGDIGPDFQRRLENRAFHKEAPGLSPSDKYGRERMQTADYEKYVKLYDRDGKYNGATLPNKKRKP